LNGEERVGEALTFLAHYYQVSRQAGHTTLLKRGLDNSEDVVLVAHTIRAGREVAQGRPSVEIVTLASLDRLRGSRKPIIFDNAALEHIFRYGARRIRQLEDRSEEAEREAAEAWGQLRTAQGATRHLGEQVEHMREVLGDLRHLLVQEHGNAEGDVTGTGVEREVDAIDEVLGK
jgi:hypothetical protein